ncbi:MAG: ubiquinol-cytochrome c reductase iron-sulfur subunit [Bacteriovoracia bacterium]
MCNEDPMNRRKMMKWIVAGIGASASGIIGVPALTNMIAPGLQRRPKHKWRSIGYFNSFTVGEITGATVNTRLDRELLYVSMKKKVFVWKKTENDVVVYSRSCTDLGCPVNFDKGSECFFCPCHGGIFSKEGERMAGPPRDPLYRFDTRIIDGLLEIDLTSVPIIV